MTLLNFHLAMTKITITLPKFPLKIAMTPHGPTGASISYLHVNRTVVLKLSAYCSIHEDSSPAQSKLRKTIIISISVQVPWDPLKRRYSG